MEVLHGVAGQGVDPSTEDYQEAETVIFKRAQGESFTDELHLLKAGKPSLTEIFK